MRGGRFHRPYPTLAHAAANAGQRHEHVPALGGLDIEPNDAELHHLVDRAVDRLPRHAEVAGDVRRAHDAADDIGHHHRLRTVDVGPAMIVKPRLQPLVEPAEALKKRDDKLVRPHMTLNYAPGAGGVPTRSR